MGVSLKANLPKNLTPTTIVGKLGGKLFDAQWLSGSEYCCPSECDQRFTIQLGRNIPVYLDGSQLFNGKLHVGVLFNDALDTTSRP